MIFYKNYPYAPLATFFSILMSIVAMVPLGFAFYFFLAPNGSVLRYLAGAVLAVAGVLIYYYLGNRVSAKLAESETDKNIRTKARYAYAYCKQHPQEYQAIAQINPDFAEKYFLNENGKVVKRK